MASISASRPRKVVSRVGRLFGVASSELTAGKSDCSPSMTSCHSRSGCSRSFSRCSPRSRRLDAIRQRIGDQRRASRRRGAPGRRDRRWRSGWRGGRAARRTSSPTGWPRRCGGRCGRAPPSRPATARRRAPAGRRPRPPSRPGADGKTAKNESPSVPTSTPPCASKAARSSSRWRSRMAGHRSSLLRSSRVEPSMSLKRNVTVPVRSSGIRCGVCGARGPRCKVALGFER